jgi:hypothetical protein
MMILHRQRRRPLAGDIARFGPTTPTQFRMSLATSVDPPKRASYRNLPHPHE